MWFCSQRISFSLSLGFPQAGTVSRRQVCKFQYERNRGRSEPVCARPGQDVNYQILINNSAIPSLVCHFIPDLVSEFRELCDRRLIGGHQAECSRGCLAGAGQEAALT